MALTFEYKSHAKLPTGIILRNVPFGALVWCFSSRKKWKGRG